MATKNLDEPTLRVKATDFSNTKNTAHIGDRKRPDNSAERTKSRTARHDKNPASGRTVSRHDDSATRIRIQHYLDGFCHAMLKGDGKTLASMWSFPSLVVDQNDTRVIQRAAEVEHFFSGAPAMYHERGIVDTRAEILSLDVISDNLVIVLVRWPYIDESGRELGHESSTYTLKANSNGEFKMCVCTMRGEAGSQDEHH